MFISNLYGPVCSGLCSFAAIAVTETTQCINTCAAYEFYSSQPNQFQNALLSTLKKKHTCQNNDKTINNTTQVYTKYEMLPMCLSTVKLPKVFERRLPLPPEAYATGIFFQRLISFFGDKRLDLEWIKKRVIEGTPAMVIINIIQSAHLFYSIIFF